MDRDLGIKREQGSGHVAIGCRRKEIAADRGHGPDRRTANRIAHRVEKFEPPVAGDLGHRHHGAEGGLLANDRNPIEAEPVQYNESAVRALAIIQFRNGEGAARDDHGTLGLQRWNKTYLSGRLKHDGHCNLPFIPGA